MAQVNHAADPPEGRDVRVRPHQALKICLLCLHIRRFDWREGRGDVNLYSGRDNFIGKDSLLRVRVCSRGVGGYGKEGVVRDHLLVGIPGINTGESYHTHNSKERKKNGGTSSLAAPPVTNHQKYNC